MSRVSNESDDAERSSLKRAGLPEQFGKRDSMERSFRGDKRRRTSLYDDEDQPTTKYDLMTLAERREEQARIETGVKQVLHITCEGQHQATLQYRTATKSTLNRFFSI